MKLWNFSELDAEYSQTKENAGRSNFDQAYGEWYKKMALNDLIINREALFFYNFW